MKQTRKLLAYLLCLLCVLSAASMAAVGADGEIRNVIFMIGDGMGYNHIKLAEEQGYEILMDDAPDLAGWSRTRSASSSVTDSAAGATALSCGVRTNNGMLGVFPNEAKRATVQPRIVTENAMRYGMKTGIVTTDLTTGATPAGFSVHTLSRNNTEDIVAQQLESGIDLIFGKEVSEATQSAVEAAGYRYLTDRAGLEALTPGVRGYGQFGSSLWKINLSSSKPSLAQMSEKAIELLSAENQNGFFLMVEGAHIDKNADDSQDGVVDYPEKKANTAEAVKTFDAAVQVAVNFARTDGHTLVVITADHETGDLRFDEDAGCMTFHSASHTGANVPVFVYGATDLFESGAEINNCDIVNLIAHKLGWRETFPIEDPARVPEQPTTQPGDSSQTDTGSKFDFLQWLRGIFQKIADFWRRVFKIN